MKKPLVIGVSSAALFDMTEEQGVYAQGLDAFHAYQTEHKNVPLDKGPAFSFIARLLDLNESLGQQVVDVVILSRNSAITGQRVFRSIQHYDLDIHRAVFTDGQSPFPYIESFDCSLYLSPNKEDVKNAIDAGFPAGIVMDNPELIHRKGHSLRIAFDFDGVLANDAAERVYAENGLEAFHSSEKEKRDEPHKPGPLAKLMIKLAEIREVEIQHQKTHPDYTRKVKLAIVTARSRDGFDRVVATLHSWGIDVDMSAFLSGSPKAPVLSVLRPIIFFDDQSRHLDSASDKTSLIHIPYGVRNTD